MRPSPHRMTLTLALAGIAVIVTAAPAFGHAPGDGDTHKGKTGRHAFVDSDKRPGARCIYKAVEPVTDVATVDPTANLVALTARPPRVAARNRTKGVDHQRVGWRFIVQSSADDGVSWTNVKRSRLQVRRTSDFRAARFTRMGVRLNSDVIGTEAIYRVKTKAFWFRPLRRAAPVAAHVVDFYRVRGGVVKGSCEGVITPEAP
jgi:hypothetical protein